MMQLNQQSKWQSWMRMLAIDIRPAYESARSTGSTRLSVSGWCDTAIAGSASIPSGRGLVPGRRLP